MWGGGGDRDGQGLSRRQDYGNSPLSVKPAAVVSWQQKRFRDYRRSKSHTSGLGRPKVVRDTHGVMRNMSVANRPPSEIEIASIGEDVAPRQLVLWRANVRQERGIRSQSATAKHFAVPLKAPRNEMSLRSPRAPGEIQRAFAGQSATAGKPECAHQLLCANHMKASVADFLAANNAHEWRAPVPTGACPGVQRHNVSCHCHTFATFV